MQVKDKSTTVEIFPKKPLKKLFSCKGCFTDQSCCGLEGFQTFCCDQNNGKWKISNLCPTTTEATTTTTTATTTTTTETTTTIALCK